VFTDRGLPERDGRILEKVLAGPLGDIAEKTLQGERLTREEGIRLAESPDLMAIGLMADYARRCRAGDIVYFINNAHINHTNICKNLCRFCAFGRKAEAPGAFVLALDEIAAKVDEFKHYLRL
jgi:aminodeoxyfutalosine synthase